MKKVVILRENCFKMQKKNDFKNVSITFCYIRYTLKL